MVRSRNWVLLGACALTGALLVTSSAVGCRTTTQAPRTNGTGGDGGNDTTSSSSSGSGSSSSGNGGAGGGSSSTGGGGGAGGSGPACDGQLATLQEINNDPGAANPVGPGVKVKVNNVIAMSQKFLVSGSKNTGSCLWGVFVSAPNVGATVAPYSGILVLSYGNKMTEQPPGSGDFFCAKLSVEPVGGAIPDDVKVGDELNVIGTSDYFLLSDCAGEVNGSTVAQRQISKACLVEKTGQTKPVPAPHEFTAAEAADIANQNDTAFHNMWGGAKLRVKGPVPTVVQDLNGTPSVITSFGEMFLEGSNLKVGRKVYYRGYLKATNKCFDNLKLSVPYTADHVDGFHYLDYCTWGISPNNRCTDLAPPSEDCATGGPGGTPLMCP